MKKSLSIIMVLLLVFMISPISFAKEMDARYDVVLNKPWNIKFNMNINEETINEDNVFITDSNNTKIQSIVYWSEFDTVTIIPIDNYSPNETYTIHIKDIKSKSGDSLKEEVTMNFTTKDNSSDQDGIIEVFDHEELYHPAASYGYYDKVYDIEIEGKKFKKAYNHGIAADSNYPASEFFIVFNNDKKYNKIKFHIIANKIANDELGIIEVVNHSDGYEVIKAITLNENELTEIEADISGTDVVWIYFSLSKGSDITILDLMAME